MFTNILLTLFVIALVLTVAGFLLSLKPRITFNRSRPLSQHTEHTSSGSYRHGARVYTGAAQESSAMQRLPKHVQPAAFAKTAALEPRPVRFTKKARLKGPTAHITYDVYREETIASRAWSHFNIMRLLRPQEGQPTPWLGVILLLVALFGFGFNLLLPILNRTSVGAFFIPSVASVPTTAAPAAKSNSAAKSAAQSPFAGVMGVSGSLVRINQMDQVQYNSSSEYDTWAASACSAAAMTEVINAYSKKNYRVTDILKVEAQLKQITPESGLLQNAGIGLTVAAFGFKSEYLNAPTLDSMEQIANQGHPVIINFPPDRWPGGHLLVLRGGQGGNVYLADSSVLNMQVMARSTFMKYWGGFGAVVYPK
jgi:Predicted double-glycine peptidase